MSIDQGRSLIYDMGLSVLPTYIETHNSVSSFDTVYTDSFILKDSFLSGKTPAAS